MYGCRAANARARQLGEQQRYKLMLGLETTDEIVGSMSLHELLENVPGNEFQYIGKDSIRVAQIADPFRVRRRRKSPNTARIFNTALYKEKMSRTAVGLARASRAVGCVIITWRPG
jgi:hypothetical protein